MKIHSETNGRLGRMSRLINNKGQVIAVSIALVIVSSLLIGYYLVLLAPPEGYSTIYILDYPQKKAIDYPELLVLGQNSTFNVWIVVENQMGSSKSFEILQKVIGDMIPSFPVETDVESSYAQTVENGGSWETLATVSIDEPGSHSVIFELWIDDEGVLEFSYNFCVLNIEVVEKI